jgi:alginate O-acetyltransferase complex protein AlgI
VLFSSPRFLIFLAVLLPLLALPLRNQRKLHLLAAASCLFYAAWDYHYVLLLLSIAVVDYYCAVQIAATADQRKRRLLLLLSVVSNLGILAYFKYANFFIANVNALTDGLGFRLPQLDVLLPAGISFYTFKTMSYTIDVYRGQLKPVRSLIDYTTFVTFFPELIAGPIVRASVFLPQMSRPIGPTRERLGLGASIFLVGLTKKVVLADALATVADPIFAQPDLFATSTVWCGVVAYTLQIYCDFSGYSDMAIGTAKMIGYDLPQNFNLPYLSPNITEFWRRWHMTLSSWLRDYVYIPLGGSRRGAARTYVNLMLTMLIGGLWHGASWNFVLWGFLHGFALVVHRFVRERTGGKPVFPALIGVPLTLLFVMICWVPFRAASFEAGTTMLHAMFVATDGVRWMPTKLFQALAVILAGHVVGWMLMRASAGGSSARERLAALLARLGASLEVNEVSGWHVRLSCYPTMGAYVVITWALLVFLFATANANPFIYFQF